MKHLEHLNSFQVSRYCQPVSYLKLFIWLLGLSVFIFCSISDFLDLLSDYSKRNIASHISVVSDDMDRLRPEGITECFPYYSGALNEIIRRLEEATSTRANRSSIDLRDCLECEAMREHSWDIWSRPEFEDPNLLPTYIVERLIVEEEATSSLDVLELNRSNFNWNQPILDAVWIFLGCTSYRDYAYIAPQSSLGFQSGWRRVCSSLNFARLGNVQRGTIERFVNSSIRAFGMYSRIKLTYSDGREEYQSLTDRTHLRFGANFVCMPSWPNVSLESVDYRAIQGDQDVPPWMRYPRTAPYRIYPNDNILCSSIFGLEAIYTTDYASVSNTTVEEVSLAYTIDSIVRETRAEIECNPDSRTSFARCVAEKQLVDISSQCGCVPFLYRHLTTNTTSDQEDRRSLPYCDEVRYRDCTVDRVRQMYDNYTAICTNRCEHVFYTWNSYSKTMNDPWSFRFQTEFHGSVRAPFVEFSTTVKSTPTQFASQIGGIVSFYLGFSGLSICGFVILCIDILMEFWTVRRRSGCSQQEAPKAEGSATAVGIERRPPEGSSAEMMQLKEELLDMKKTIRRIEEKLDKVTG